MPVLPDAPKCLKIQYQGTYGTTKWANILHAQYVTGPPTQADINSIAASYRHLWGTIIGTLLSSNVAMSQVVVTDINSKTGLVGTDVLSQVGSVAPPDEPAQVAVVVSWKIARRYRGGHPRIYLPGIPTAALADHAHLLDTTATNWTTTMQTFLTNVQATSSASTGALTPVNVGYWHTPVKGQPPVLLTVPNIDPITTAHVGKRIDSQRRRLGKV